MDDKLITDLLFERSEQAVEELTKKYGRMLNALAYNILGDERDAEECVNDTYLGVWNSIPPRRPDSLAAYVTALARNTAISRYHRLTAKKRNSFYDTALEELEACLPAIETAESELEAAQLREAINDFLATLSRDDRRMFVLRYYMAESVADIGQSLGISSKRVSLRLFRIRGKLKNHLMKEGMLT